MSTTLNKFGFRQLDPIPTDERLKNFYESEYYHLIKAGGRASELRKLMEGGETTAREIEWLQNTLYTDCVDAIATYADTTNPILDIGCGTGNLVEFLQRANLPAQGIEPSEEATSIAISRGLNVRQLNLEDLANAPDEQNKYSAATLINVLEHVPNPAEFLENTTKILSKNGILIIRVPNDFSEIQRIAELHVQKKEWWVASPDHINYFSATSLTNLLDSLSFEVVDLYVDFPMELFLLFGVNYIDSPSLGADAHKMRANFEMRIPKELRRSLYKKFPELNMGRNLFMIARLKK